MYKIEFYVFGEWQTFLEYKYTHYIAAWKAANARYNTFRIVKK